MCCYSIAKYLLFAFNFVFWLAGCAVLGVGIWLNVDQTTKDSVEVAGIEFYYAGAIVLIVAGCVMLIVGFFGCCGAIKENTCLLGTYFVFLFIIFALEVAIGIWAFVTYDTLQDAINENIVKTDLTDETQRDLLRATEQNLECCGTINGCSDWDVPGLGSYGCGCDLNNVKDPSNCVLLATTSGCKADTYPDSSNTRVYNQSCAIATYDLIYDNLTIVGAIGLAIGLAEIIGMIVSMCLCCSVKNKGHHSV